MSQDKARRKRKPEVQAETTFSNIRSGFCHFALSHKHKDRLKWCMREHYTDRERRIRMGSTPLLLYTMRPIVNTPGLPPQRMYMAYTPLYIGAPRPEVKFSHQDTLSIRHISPYKDKRMRVRSSDEIVARRVHNVAVRERGYRRAGGSGKARKA